MFAHILPIPSCLLPASVFGRLFLRGDFSAVLLFKLGQSAIVSLVPEQEALGGHVCSQGFILGMCEEGRGEMEEGSVGLISYCPQPLTMSLAS